MSSQNQIAWRHVSTKWDCGATWAQTPFSPLLCHCQLNIISVMNYESDGNWGNPLQKILDTKPDWYWEFKVGNYTKNVGGLKIDSGNNWGTEICFFYLYHDACHGLRNRIIMGECGWGCTPMGFQNATVALEWWGLNSFFLWTRKRFARRCIRRAKECTTDDVATDGDQHNG